MQAWVSRHLPAWNWRSMLTMANVYDIHICSEIPKQAFDLLPNNLKTVCVEITLKKKKGLFKRENAE